MPKTKKMNRFQRKALKGKEERVTGEMIWQLVDQSSSSDPMVRLEAAENLCPCHVRRRIDEVWEALYRLLEDSDSRVRRAAFHTLYDGGSLDDPGLDDIFKRMLETETHPKLRRQLESEVNKRATAADEREHFTQQARFAVGDYPERDKCDFCGETAPVRRDYDTHVPDGGSDRPAMVCASCDE
jgi:HEAT repeat protein